MRVIKEAEMRRKEILDVAEVLFYTKGYDKTSTNDILDNVGIARGTLYYHFKSKEDILDALIDRTVEMIAKRIKDSISDDMNAETMLKTLFTALHVDDSSAQKLALEAHKPQNALMHQKIQSKTLSTIIPLVASIIEHGNQKGFFKTEFPDVTAEMLLLYGGIVFDDLTKMDSDNYKRKVLGFTYNMERLLGLEKGSLLGLTQYIG